MTKIYLQILLILFTSNIYANSIIMHGKVIDATNTPIQGVNIFSNTIGTTSNADGYFSITIPRGNNVVFQHIGYKTLEKVPTSEFVLVRMNINILEGKNIHISANRAIPGITPVAYSSLTPDEIDNHFTLEDVPMILSYEPGVYAYSESGNGTGYTYVSIRGFDQSEIAVMIDNVPMNDNKSHQVYWADHGNILNDVKEIQVQRGIGNSMYGAAAFGGSINVHTKIKSNNPSLEANIGTGSFNSSKISMQYNAGNNWGNNTGINMRISQITSSGYRKYHNSIQNALSIGIEHSTKNLTNQFRALIGHVNSDLTWDGIYGDNIYDRELRRDGYKGFTDDFLQQIYSINSRYTIDEQSVIQNTFYYVKGSGYYETEKSGKTFYSYNLDFIDGWADNTTDLLRRKWIVNNYIGLSPSYTLLLNRFRIDIGGEFRIYSGDHFGEVSQFSNPLLALVSTPYTYYKYLGKKQSTTTYIHSTYSANEYVHIFAELQYVNHDWKMEQDKIGHAQGHIINANWNFLNPRIGFNYQCTNNHSIFGKVGTSQKEPKDDQIIDADEWAFNPKGAYPEKIIDYELGLHSSFKNFNTLINIYLIQMENEVLENIDFEEEGQYIYEQVDQTTHQGIEFDIHYTINEKINLNWNAALSHNYFNGGILNNKHLPKQPNQLSNLSIEYCSQCEFSIHSTFKYVGKQYVDNANTEASAVDNYYLVNLGIKYSIGSLTLSGKINNLLDTLYITHGESWGAYWPGATRSIYMEMKYQF